MRYYSYPEFRQDIKTLSRQWGDYKPDALVAIARGGMTMGHMLAHTFDLRHVFLINSVFYEGEERLEGVKISNIPSLSGFKNILIVDEIVDSGASLAKVLEVLTFTYPEIEFKSAVLFQKEGALIKADYYVHEALEWISFFWEVDSQ